MDILTQRLKQYNRRLEKRGKEKITIEEYEKLYYGKNKNYLGNENKAAGLKGEELGKLVKSISLPKNYNLNGEPLTQEKWDQIAPGIIKEFTKNIMLRNKVRNKYNKEHGINKVYETYFNRNGTWSESFKKANDATKMGIIFSTLNSEEKRRSKKISRYKWTMLNERRGLSAFTESLKQISKQIKNMDFEPDELNVFNFFKNLTFDKIKILYDKMETDPAAKNILNGILNNYHLGLDPTAQITGNLDIFKRIIE